MKKSQEEIDAEKMFNDMSPDEKYDFMLQHKLHEFGHKLEALITSEGLDNIVGMPPYIIANHLSTTLLALAETQKDLYEFFSEDIENSGEQEETSNVGDVAFTPLKSNNITRIH